MSRWYTSAWVPGILFAVLVIRWVMSGPAIADAIELARAGGREATCEQAELTDTGFM